MGYFLPAWIFFIKWCQNCKNIFLAQIQLLVFIKGLPGHKESIDILKFKIHLLFAKVFEEWQISLFSCFFWLFWLVTANSAVLIDCQLPRKLILEPFVNKIVWFDRWLLTFCVLLFCLQYRKIWRGKDRVTNKQACK